MGARDTPPGVIQPDREGDEVAPWALAALSRLRGRHRATHAFGMGSDDELLTAWRLDGTGDVLRAVTEDDLDGLVADDSGTRATAGGAR
jgi:hypothetical protein